MRSGARPVGGVSPHLGNAGLPVIFLFCRGCSAAFVEGKNWMTEPCMRTPAAALYLGIAERPLNKMRLTGYGPPFVKVGPRAIVYRKADLDV